MKKWSFALLFMGFTFMSLAQSADEIVNGYLDAIGGRAKLDKLNGIKMMASVDQMGMKIPLEMVNLRTGKMYVKFTFQGNEMTQIAFDGTDSWGINFMSMKAEKNDSETTENVKRGSVDFITPLYLYGQNGYTLEKLDDDDIDGVKCFKLKLTKKPSLAEGKEVPNIELYYIDKETYALIASETEITSGEAKGTIAQTVYSDYQEVDGIYFPYSIINRMKGGEGQGLKIDKIELNPSVDDKRFVFPTE